MSRGSQDRAGEDNLAFALRRRDLVQAAGALVVPTLSAYGAIGNTARADESRKIDELDLHIRVNGHLHALTSVDPRTTLLDALRDHLGLTGTKKGCDQGQCGACTVHVNGSRVLACLSLVALHDGDEVTTIEGLADGPTLHPVQAAFVEQDALQCGYCTPGQVMSAVACIAEGHANSDEEIREWMVGNLCRCGAYANIVAAVREAAAHQGMGSRRPVRGYG